MLDVYCVDCTTVVDHRTFVRFIPGSRRRLQHSTFTFHIMPSNNQLTHHHAHKLTRTFVWIAFFVCTEFDKDINSSSYYSRQTCRTSLTMSIFVTTRRQFSWSEKCTKHLSSKLQLCPTCMCMAYLDSCSVQRYTTPVQPIPWIIFSRYDQTIFGQFSLQILQRRFSPCGQANGERGARGGRLSYRCLGWKLVNLYVDAVDGYDDTTA